MTTKKYYRLLTIAGSDSGGGAGIQADLKTFSALGGYGMSVITALTAQNTVAVTAIHEVPPDFIAKQMDAVLTDIGVDAVKIGMLHSSEVIYTVAERLRHHNVKNIVLDTVMIAKSGDKLLHNDAVDALREELIPLSTIITPNIPEASVLINGEIHTRFDMEKAGILLLALGTNAVLIKGGHTNDTNSADCLLIKNEKGDTEIFWFEEKRIETKNTHGTGCTLSSAIAVYLAKGFSIKESVELSKKYITEAIRAGADYQLGKGNGPVNHFYLFKVE